jgi:hypothetical protein
MMRLSTINSRSNFFFHGMLFKKVNLITKICIGQNLALQTYLTI